MVKDEIIYGLSDGGERFSAVIPSEMFTGIPIKDRDGWLADAFRLARNVYPDTHRKHSGPCGKDVSGKDRWLWGFVSYYEAKDGNPQFVYIQQATQDDKE